MRKVSQSADDKHTHTKVLLVKMSGFKMFGSQEPTCHRLKPIDVNRGFAPAVVLFADVPRICHGRFQPDSKALKEALLQ